MAAGLAQLWSSVRNRTRGIRSSPGHQIEAARKPDATKSVSGADVVPAASAADIELVERYCLDWFANSHTYVANIDELRRAARRILPDLDSVPRLRDIPDHIAVLARNPLYFPEIFHGETCRPDGTYGPLSPRDRLHFSPAGLLSPGDRRAIEQVYIRLLEKCGNRPLRIAEIGSAVGRGSTRIGGKLVKENGGLLYCIDAWTDSDWYFAFIAHLQIFELERTVIPIRSPSADAAKLFEDGSLDAVLLDGSHIYPDVLADIDAYRPKLRKGGLLFGHDLNDVPSRFDRSELLAVSTENRADVNYMNAQGEIVRENVHPGVILAVGDRFGDDIELFPDSVVWAKQF